MSVGEGPAIPLTPMQRRFMLALQARLAARPGMGPTYDELREDLGLASKSGVARLVRECVERGRIARIPRAERSLTVIHPVEGVDATRAGLLDAFSDTELLREVIARGLLAVRADLADASQEIRGCP